MASEYLDNPYHIDVRGRSALTLLDEHVRDMIYEVLFTAPGERVNRPDFGCGIRQLIFMGNSDALAGATQFLVQGSLQHWLGDIIKIDGVSVVNENERLTIQVVYTRRDNNQRQNVTFFMPPAGL
jgi:phage baseplate assembly protein W